MNKFPSLKQLHYLVTLSETRHFGEAAKRCFVSQSTLSSGIQNLEGQLGCQLLERDNKAFFFTPMGEDFLVQARELLAKAQDLLELTKDRNGDMEGELKIGCIPTIAPFLLGSLINVLSDNYPKLHVLLREDTTHNLLTALRNGEMDVLILALPTDISGMKSLLVGKDPFKLVISSRQAQYLTFPLQYQNLPDASFFLLEREHCLTNHALSACHLTHIEKINSFSATSLHTLVQMIANGNGMTFIPQMAIDHGLLQGLDLVILDPPKQPAYREIGLVWRPSSNRAMTFSLLADIVKDSLPKHNDR